MSRLSDEPIPLATLPQRPKPLLELGSPFLGTGRIRRGFKIPGGAVWQPSFLLFGTMRTGLAAHDDDRVRTGQWANRLDLFGNLYLSGTERLVFGLRPLDKATGNGGRLFSGYTSVSPDPLDTLSSFNNGFSFDWDTVTHLFFEGDLGEIFPSLDPEDRRALDLGFSVGRQPVNFQEGLLINDFVDAVGITRNNLRTPGIANLRITGLYAWNQIHRNTPSQNLRIRNLEADSAKLAGIFTETDWRFSTVSIDAIYVHGGTFRRSGYPDIRSGSGLFAGVSFVQRRGSLNSSFRVLTSIPIGAQTPEDNALGVTSPIDKGTLLFGEISWTPHHTHDLVYVNGFAALADYRAAALDPTVPGPLARAGILFAAPGLGNYPGALSPTASDVVGGTVGYQKFLARTRQQLLFELGGRWGTDDCVDGTSTCNSHSVAGGVRYQIAMGRRMVLVLDSFAGYENLRGSAEIEWGRSGRTRVGARIELLVKF